MYDIIKIVAVSIIIPVVGLLITKHLDNSFTKQIKEIKNDIEQIKKELQINATLEEQIDRLESVSAYCIRKYISQDYKNVFTEKNLKFIECITRIARNEMFAIDKWDEAKDILDAGYCYCENYLKMNLSEEFCKEFLPERKINYKLFLQQLEQLIFANINQRIIKIFDTCVTFIKRYNEVAERLEK